MPEVHLYDANGGYVGLADLAEVPTSDHSIKVGGNVYVWDSRNGRFRAVGPSIAGKLNEDDEPEAKMMPPAENKMMPTVENKMPPTEPKIPPTDLHRATSTSR
jgi:hypothetical protein